MLLCSRTPGSLESGHAKEEQPLEGTEKVTEASYLRTSSW